MALLFLSLAAFASAATINATVGFQDTAAFADSIVLCNSSFSAANSTGIFYNTPTFNKDARYGAALTLAQNQKISSPTYGLQASLMFTPLTQDYFNDTKTGYDVCALAVNVQALTTNSWLRGQSDNGSCIQTFDAGCISDLRTAVEALATGDPQAACDNINAKLTNNVPDSCQPYLASGTSFLGGYEYLTQAPGDTTSTFNEACKLTENGTTWYNLLTEVGGYSAYTYEISATVTWPIITVFLPSAKNPSIDTPHATFTCLHTTHFNPGSQVVNITQTPTPVATSSATSTASSSKSISGGAIAGIIIAALAFLALVALGAWWFWWRRRTPKQQELEATEIYTAEEKRQRKYSEAADTSIAELSPDTHKAELPTQFSSELYGDHHYELEGDRFIHELPAHSDKIK